MFDEHVDDLEDFEGKVPNLTDEIMQTLFEEKFDYVLSVSNEQLGTYRYKFTISRDGRFQIWKIRSRKRRCILDIDATTVPAPAIRNMLCSFLKDLFAE